jgi:hypothetical protein
MIVPKILTHNLVPFESKYPHPAFTKCPILANGKSLPVHPPSQDSVCVFFLFCAGDQRKRACFRGEISTSSGSKLISVRARMQHGLLDSEQDVNTRLASDHHRDIATSEYTSSAVTRVPTRDNMQVASYSVLASDRLVAHDYES